jgi:F-type H+-transporting ATPase subunit b
MNIFRQKSIPDVLPSGIFIFFVLISGTAYAAENVADWRSTYDLVMRWVNFFILVAILVRFGKTPVKKLIFGLKDSLEAELKQLEQEKQQAEEKAESAQKMLDDSHIRLNKLTERITMQGERKRKEIIQDAKRESKVILDSTKRKLESQIIKAREDLRAELVDAAIASAFKKLPKVIKIEDHQKFFNKYIDSLKI